MDKFSKFLFVFLSLLMSSEVFGQCPPSPRTANNTSYTITGDCVINGNLSLRKGNLTINPGGSLTVTGGFVSENGNNIMTINTDGEFIVEGAFDIGGGVVNISGGDLTIGTDPLSTSAGSYSSSSGNGTLSLTDNGSLTVWGDYTSGTNATTNFTEGTATIKGDYNNNGNGSIAAGGLVKVEGDFNNTAANADLSITGGLSVGGNLDLGGNTTTISGAGAVVSAGSISNPPAADIAVNDGGTIYVQDGTTLSDGIISFNPAPTDGDCANNCCGSLCNTVGDNLSGTGNETLPILLSSFDLVKKETYVEIQWVSQTELNNDFYELERAVGGSEFSVIAKIDGAGNSQSPIAYSYQDYINNDGLVYYRLKQTDFDGKFEYFDIKTIDASDLRASKLKIMPNRAKSGSRVKIVGLPASDEPVELRLFDLAGRNSFQIEMDFEFGQHSFVIPNIQSGVYILIGQEYGIQIRERLMVQ